MMNPSHSSATEFGDVECTRWPWPKWSTELDAFCDSAKNVIRKIGSKLQLEEEEDEEEEEENKVYFCPPSTASSTQVYLSPYDIALGGVGQEEAEDFQEGGVGDSDGGGYLSDVSVSTNLEHGYGYTHRRVENAHRPCPDELYSQKRQPAAENPSPEIDVVAYFTRDEYNEDGGGERLYENHPEEYPENRELRGRSLKRMAGPITRTSSPSLVARERKKSKSSRRRSSSHEEEDPVERERRRQERRKRRAEREGKRTRESVDEVGRREVREKKERHRQKKEPSPPPLQPQPAPKKVVESIWRDNKKNRYSIGYSIEDVLGLPSSRSRSISVRRPIRVRSNHSLRATRSDARLRPDSRLKVPPDGTRIDSTKRTKEPSKLATVVNAGQRSPSRQRHRKHHDDHSTPELKAICQRCIQKKEKREKKRAELNIEIAPEPMAIPAAAPKKVEVRIQEPKVERKREDKAKVKISEPVKPTLKRSKQFLGLPIEKKTEKLVQCITCLADDIPHKEAAHLACDHSWCHECLKRIFTLSLTDPAHMPPKCCNDEHVPLKHVDKLLSYQTKKLWNKKYIEYTTSNRIYCPEVNCGEWIQPKDIEAGVGKCSRCKTKVCALCNGKAHGDGECPKDEDLMKFIETAKKNKFQRCYSCRAVVELERGCNHMTCRCTAEFCYICGEKWKTCNCPWFNYEPEEDDYVIPIWNPDQPAAALPAEFAERREQRARAREEQLRADEELARRLAREEGARAPAALGSSDEYYLPSPLQIDALATLGTIGTGLRNGIRRLAADYVEATQAARAPALALAPTPARVPRLQQPPRVERRRTEPPPRVRQNRSREEIRENLVNLLQEAQDLETRPSPRRAETEPIRPKTPQLLLPAPPAPEPTTESEPEPEPAPAPAPAPMPSRYLSEDRQAHIEEYLRNLEIPEPEPVSPIYEEPRMQLSRRRRNHNFAQYDLDIDRRDLIDMSFGHAPAPAPAPVPRDPVAEWRPRGFHTGRVGLNDPWNQHPAHAHPMFRRAMATGEVPRRWGAERRGY